MRGFVEQVAAVGQAAAEALVEVGDLQVEVELGRPRIVGDVLDGHPGQLPGLLEFPALNVAHHLEQRVVGGAARRLQGFHQVVERQVLVRLAIDHGLPHLLKQLADTHLSVEPAAQHLGIEEGADQPFALRADAVRHRRADTQVLLAAVAVEQGRKGGGHGHEHGQPAGGVEAAHALGQLGAQVEAVEVALVALHRRAWPVARQFEQRDARCPAGPSSSRAGAGARRSPATRAATRCSPGTGPATAPAAIRGRRGRPRRARPSSRAKMSIAQPSVTMWCRVTTR
ncbi:Uncharacterised protein [Pseudomonas aeruginosa]|nr:Uncharacterised protein [Pseudomonas aeruginosa]